MKTRPRPGGEPVHKVLDLLPDVRTCGDGWSARCPAHEDDRPSLAIGMGRDGRVLLHCHAGCDIRNIVAAIGLTLTDLFHRNNPDER